VLDYGLRNFFENRECSSCAYFPSESGGANLASLDLMSLLCGFSQ
jgi:hypothetical protein